MNRYDEGLFDLPAIRIVAGEYVVTSEDVVIVTLLGSCVAACIRDPITGIAGMNHFMLPSDASSGARRPDANYGVSSMRQLIDEMLERGANAASLQAKIFGGGDVTRRSRQTPVGGMNAEFAIEYLRANNIELLASDVRGTHPRKVFFVCRTGQVFVHYLREAAAETA